MVLKLVYSFVLFFDTVRYGTVRTILYGTISYTLFVHAIRENINGLEAKPLIQ